MPYVETPPAPDIRQQRPGYFMPKLGPPVQYPREAAYPQGFTPYDPSADQWQNEMPDMWPQIEQELLGIIERGPGQIYVPRAGQKLTKEEEEHNRLMMALKVPQGLQALEMGELRKQQQKNEAANKAEARLSKLENQLGRMATAKTPPGKGIISMFEKRYNKAADDYDEAMGISKDESPYVRYKGDGSLAIVGEEPQKGIIGKIGSAIGRALTSPQKLLQYGTEQVPEAQSPEAMMVDDRTVQQLTGLDQKIKEVFGADEAKTVVQQINTETQDPGERVARAVEAIKAKVPNDPLVKQLEREMTAQKVAQTPETPEAEKPLNILQRFQQSLPTNQEYIEGGGLPGVLLRGLGRGTQEVQQPLEQINTLEERVRRALEAKRRK